MHNLDKLNTKNLNKGKKCNNLKYALMLAISLGIGSGTGALAQSSQNRSTNAIEISTGEFMDNLNKKLGVRLPSFYDSKVRKFVDTNFVMRDKDVRKFTEDFIFEQMKSNRGISKENQLIFIRDAIYSQIIGNDLYDGEDGDTKRLQEYEISIAFSEPIGKIYKEKLTTYIGKITEESKQRTEESKQRIEQSQQRTNESISRIMSTDTAGLKEMTRFYNLYKKSPNSVKPEELAQAKKFANNIISSCKKYGIDYKKILPVEVRKFYGIE